MSAHPHYKILGSLLFALALRNVAFIICHVKVILMMFKLQTDVLPARKFIKFRIIVLLLLFFGAVVVPKYRIINNTLIYIVVYPIIYRCLGTY